VIHMSRQFNRTLKSQRGVGGISRRPSRRRVEEKAALSKDRIKRAACASHLFCGVLAVSDSLLHCGTVFDAREEPTASRETEVRSMV
jgi:hypothetical protein